MARISPDSSFSTVLVTLLEFFLAYVAKPIFSEETLRGILWTNDFSKPSYTGPPFDLGQYLWSILDDILSSKVLASVFGLWHVQLIFGIFFSFRHSLLIKTVSSYSGLW